MNAQPVRRLKGRALIYPALLIAGWIGGRVMIVQAEVDTVARPMQLAQQDRRSLAVAQGDRPLICQSWPWLAPSQGGAATYPATAAVVAIRPARAIRFARPDGERETGTTHDLLASSQIRSPELPGSFFLQSPAEPARQAQANPVSVSPAKRLQVYTYSFWRQQSMTSGLAPAAQYGGSQAGVIATWDPFGSAVKGAALLARAATTPDGIEREAALGLRWRPDSRWPVSLSAERRFRLNDRDRFAAYLAGGVDAVPVLGKAKLDAYGQAGYATGRGGGGFFDAQGRLLHPVAAIAGIPFSAGAGAWAGGQRGTARLDIGPTLRTRVNTGLADFTLQLDWRQRVAGNAEPRDGLALTISSGF